jgi:hypothetical protein
MYVCVCVCVCVCVPTPASSSTPFASALNPVFLHFLIFRRRHTRVEVLGESLVWVEFRAQGLGFRVSDLGMRDEG